MITIVLLSYSIVCLGNNNQIPSTGELDSVLISYDDLRIVNSKLVELDYTKQINTKYKSVISNDSAIINNYKQLNANINKTAIKYKKQRNSLFYIAIATTISFIISMIK